MKYVKEKLASLIVTDNILNKYTDFSFIQLWLQCASTNYYYIVLKAERVRGTEQLTTA